MLLGRLAVDHRHTGGGLGSGMLRDAIMRVVEAADVVGVRALLVHALDDAAAAWCLRRAEFIPSPSTPGP